MPPYISTSIEVIPLYFAAVVVVALWFWTVAQLRTVHLIQIFKGIILHTQDQQNDAVTYPWVVKFWSVTVVFSFLSRVDACSAIII